MKYTILLKKLYIDSLIISEIELVSNESL